MKVIKKNVYYCDHCDKKGLVALHIRKHEARCTNNPNRYCGVCESIGQLKFIVERFKIRFTLADNPLLPINPHEDIYDPSLNYDEKLVTWVREPITLQEIRKSVDDCPACLLAVLRQTGLNMHYFHLDKFDFKKELQDYISAKGMPSNYYN